MEAIRLKLFFISDIHGSLFFLKKSLEKFKEECADYIIILGDALYHGPRNDLPEDYNPKEVAKILNEYKEKIIAVRGNCDCEVDQMIIEYPMMSDYNVILYKNRRIFLTHGHIFNEEKMPILSKGDIFIYGHTHIPCIKDNNGIKIINPGSISIPKGGYKNSYGVLKNDIFTIKDFSGNIIIQNNIL